MDNNPTITESVLARLVEESEEPLALRAAYQRAREEVEALETERFGLQRALARVKGEEPPTRGHSPRRYVTTTSGGFRSAGLWSQAASESPVREQNSRLAQMDVEMLSTAKRLVDTVERAQTQLESFTPKPVDVRPRKRAEAVVEILNNSSHPMTRKEISGLNSERAVVPMTISTGLAPRCPISWAAKGTFGRARDLDDS